MTGDIVASNSLADLAARIRAEHEGARAAVKRGIEHALAVGACHGVIDSVEIAIREVEYRAMREWVR